MYKAAHSKLAKFYQQALLSPDLLCLSCHRSVWNNGRPQCSPNRRRECALFVEDMAGKLAMQPPQPHERRPATTRP